MRHTDNLIANRPQSLVSVLLERVDTEPDREAYRYPVPSLDGSQETWETLTWGAAAARIFAISAGLMELGVSPEERVAIASATRIEWILADLGIMCAGAATTTIYPSTTAKEAAFILADSGSRVLIAENAEQLAKIIPLRAELPQLAHIVLIDADADTPENDGWVLSLAELEERGQAYLAQRPNAVREVAERIDRNQLATLIYTSGTTGPPKGVRLRHDCWAYMVRAIEANGTLNREDVQYLWLPLAHVFGKVCVTAHIAIGFVTAVDGRVEKIVQNMPMVRPTYMAAVPRIFEKVHSGIAAQSRAGGSTKFAVFQWAVGVAQEYAVKHQDLRERGKAPAVPFLLSAKRAIADLLVLAKVREVFGGRMRLFLSGSAPLSPDIGFFFAGAGLRILDGYGLTESSAASFLNPLDDCRVGTVGTVFPGTEARIADDGEILLRGPSIMEGYHGRPDETARVLESDGWFHTGDIGELSPDGYLRITDRKKDLIKTSNGKYIAPAAVESQLRAVCPLISNAVVLGASRNFCSALLALDEGQLIDWAQRTDLRALPYSALVTSELVRSALDPYVQRVNSELQPWQQIKSFRVLPRDLSVERGELTPSLKVRREVVETEFADLIGEMYDGTWQA